MGSVTQEQLSHLSEVIATYSVDADDPSALEVLLVLQEVCHILEISHYEMVTLFGQRTLRSMRGWRPRRGAARASGGPDRVWIWWPMAPKPMLCKILSDGVVDKGEEGLNLDSWD